MLLFLLFSPFLKKINNNEQVKNKNQQQKKIKQSPQRGRRFLSSNDKTNKYTRLSATSRTGGPNFSDYLSTQDGRDSGGVSKRQWEV
uniref:Uncharacterized protein n=1 Tax=Salix viminalis TaxID=40686 RepID=A0A6N2JYS6_SALVM